MTNRRNWIGSDELWCIIKIWSVDEFEPSMENICISQSWSYSIFWWWIRIYWCTWTSHLKRSAYFFPFKQSIGSFFTTLYLCVFHTFTWRYFLLLQWGYQYCTSLPSWYCSVKSPENVTNPLPFHILMVSLMSASVVGCSLV